MRWVTSPTVAPYGCSLCHNGPENAPHKPFLLTEWRYSEDSDLQFKEQVASRGEVRLIICAVCFNEAAMADGSPLKALIRRGGADAATPAPIAAPVPYEPSEEDVARIIAHYEYSRAAERMQKARDGRNKTQRATWPPPEDKEDAA